MHARGEILGKSQEHAAIRYETEGNSCRKMINYSTEYNMVFNQQ